MGCCRSLYGYMPVSFFNQRMTERGVWSRALVNDVDLLPSRAALTAPSHRRLMAAVSGSSSGLSRDTNGGVPSMPQNTLTWGKVMHALGSTSAYAEVSRSSCAAGSKLRAKSRRSASCWTASLTRTFSACHSTLDHLSFGGHVAVDGCFGAEASLVAGLELGHVDVDDVLRVGFALAW